MNWYKKMDKREKLRQVIFMILLLGVMGILLLFIDGRIDYLLDSDASSEMILSKIMATKNTLITNSWYYSTELRVIGINIIYMFMFKITNNWHLVRVVSCFILYILMLSSYLMYCRRVKLDKYFFLSSLIFLVPISKCYFNFVLAGNYYIPYIIFSFILLALIEGNTKKIKMGKLLLLFVVSLIFSLNGIRQLIIFHVPVLLSAIFLFGSEFINYDKVKVSKMLKSSSFNYLISSLVSIVGSFVGYLINSMILTKLYKFQSWDSISFSSFDMQKIGLLINNFLESYGYREGSVFSSVLVSNICCIFFILMSIISICYALKNSKKVSRGYLHLSLFYVSAIVVFFGLYTCTDMLIVARYNLPIIVFSIPLVFLFVKEVNFVNKDIMRYRDFILYGFVTVICLGGVCNYNYLRYTDKTSSRRKIVKVLEDKRYYSGYATFWQANVLTELSNGDIDIWSWCDSGNNGEFLKNIDNIDATFKWLQKTSHDDNHPKGKVFILLTKDELENFKWKSQLKKSSKVIYHSDFYVVYGFDSYNDMVNKIKST